MLQSCDLIRFRAVPRSNGGFELNASGAVTKRRNQWQISPSRAYAGQSARQRDLLSTSQAVLTCVYVSVAGTSQTRLGSLAWLVESFENGQEFAASA